MSIRLYALSTELGVPSKRLLELCKLEEIDVSSHASTLTDSEANRLRAHIQRDHEAQQKAPAPVAADDGAVPPPLVDQSKLMALKLSSRRKPPPQRGVAVPGTEGGEPIGIPEAAVAEAAPTVIEPAAPVAAPEATPAPKPAAAVKAPAPAAAVAPAVVAPTAPVAPTVVVSPAPAPVPVAEAPAAKAPVAKAPTAKVVAAPEVVEEPVVAAEAAPPAAPVAEAAAVVESVEAIAAAPAAPAARQPVSIDEFVIEVPKAIGRIEGIVPKEFPSRGAKDRKKPRARQKDGKEVEGEKPATAAAPRAHPQAVGLKHDEKRPVNEAGRKAREVAEKAIREAHKQPATQRGLTVDTNRPQSGRTASAGGRRRIESGPAEVEQEAVETPDTTFEKKLNKGLKKGSQTRRADRIEVDTDVDILGTGHMRLERGEQVKRPLMEHRRRQRMERTKRGDQPHVQGGAVEIEEPITVKSFCAAVGVQSAPVIAKLMQRGLMVTVNQVIDNAVAEELALEYGIELRVKAELDADQAIAAEVAALDALHEGEPRLPRTPVVTFLGHVDHGKTSLMDRIRSAHVAAGESGGITQHIGAYRVERNGKFVTFLDTPGHQAFTAMRARGAKITDIVVLVVAADDGVMPQTDEAINHAKAAGVPIVVAMNKIDKADANPTRTLGQLAERELVPEEWGGKTMVVQTSATTGVGVDQLLEGLGLEAELLELNANPLLNARGAVVEAQMREGLGPVATLLVQDGTLRLGDIILAGAGYGRVRAMSDDRGQAVQEAIPGMAVSLSGLASVPLAGDRFHVLDDLQKARDFAELKERKIREQSLTASRHVTLEKLFEQIKADNIKELSVIVKADVQGSVEVLRQALSELKHPEVQVGVLHAAVGGVNESDVLLADASNAIIIGFHVIADERARALAEQKGVDIRLYSIIYQIIDDLKKALEGMLAPERRENITGHVTVRTTFKISKIGTVAGCYVTDGTIRRSSRVRVTRQGVVVYEGTLDSLKRFKDDVREVTSGMECGLKIVGFDDIKVDDVVEAVEIVEIKRSL